MRLSFVSGESTALGVIQRESCIRADGAFPAFAGITRERWTAAV